jgi:hypothetical protein
MARIRSNSEERNSASIEPNAAGSIQSARKRKFKQALACLMKMARSLQFCFLSNDRVPESL